MSKINKTPEKTPQFDPKKSGKLLEALLSVYQEYQPTEEEILVTYGNLGYMLGAAIGKVESPGPSVEELEKKCLTGRSTVAEALMFQGILTTSWSESKERQ